MEAGKNPDLIVVGDGIAARALVHEILEVRRMGLDVLCLSAGALFPSCSQASTATVCLDGVRSGVSPLGDLLVRAHDRFHQVAGSLPGVQMGEHRVQLSARASSKERENFERRYGGKTHMPCAFIHPKTLLASLHSPRARYEQALICDYDEESGPRVRAYDGRWFKARQIVWASGSWPGPPQGIPAHRPLSGHFLLYPEVDAGALPLSLEVKGGAGIKLLYRASSKELLVGTVSSKDTAQAPDWAALLQLDTRARAQWPELPWPNTRPKALVGVRAKGAGMHPFWGKVPGHTGLLSVANLYKNGWSYAFLAAQELSELLKK